MRLPKEKNYEDFQKLVWSKYQHDESETPEDIFERVADVYYPEMKKIYFDEDGNASFRVVPGGRILYAAGKEGASPYNCSVIPSPHDSMEGIFETAKIMAMSYKSGLGVGLDISTLRPENSRVSKGSAKISTGAWSWADLFSLVTGIVGQAHRRGACLMSMDITHPDIEKFITMKSIPNQESKNFVNQLGLKGKSKEFAEWLLSRNQVRYANISIRMRDDFMKLVEAGRFDEVYEQTFLIQHDNGETEEFSKKIKVGDLWNLILKNINESSEPGILFYDTMKKYSLNDKWDPLVTTNPCLAGNTELFDFTRYISIEDAAKNGAKTFKAWYTGEKKTIRLLLSNGNILECTPDHKIMLQNGNWIKAKDANGKKLAKVGCPCGDDLVVDDIEDAGIQKVYDFQMNESKHPFNFTNTGVIVHNCGEINLPEWGVCNLQSINLVAHIDIDEEGKAYINEEKLRETVDYAIRFGDILIDKAYFPIKEFKDKAHRDRPIGLGIMGLADTFILMKTKYGSNKSVNIANKIMSIIAHQSYKTSIDMAKEKGAAPGIIDYAESVNMDKRKRKYSWILENSEYIKFLVKQFPDLKDDIEKYGLRNIFLMSIAPTGSISLISGVSAAFEPNFGFTMNRWSDSFKKEVTIEQPIYTYVKNNPNYNIDADYMVTMMDIDPYEKMKLQEVLQKWVDASISNTYTLTEEYNEDDIGKMIIDAWKKKLKGITFYKYGTRGAIIKLDKDDEEKCGNIAIDISNVEYDRPTSLTARSYKYNYESNNYYIIVAGEKNAPLEIYLGSKNIKEQSYIIALNSVISTVLKTSYSISTKYETNLYKIILEKIIHELLDVKDGSFPHFFMGKKYYSPVAFWGYSLQYFRDKMTPEKEKEKRIEKANKQASILSKAIENNSTPNIYDFYPGGLDDDIQDDAIFVKCPICGSIIWTKKYEFEFDCNNPCPKCGYSKKCD